MNLSDAENPELSQPSSTEPEDTEIVAGDEGNLAPIYDIDVEAGGEIGEAASAYVLSEDVSANADDGNPVAVEPDDFQAAAPQLLETEAVVQEEETLQLAQPVSGWQRFKQFFTGGASNVMTRLNNLTQAIEDAPESAVNYVLRAELYMQMREYALAQADFLRAYELAEVEFEVADWGIVDQVMRDRALAGLEKVQRRLR